MRTQTLIDRYIMRQVAVAAGLIALTLAGVLLMTQSLRFLELIIESGASGLAFITLSLLALPRFFEVILPVALSAGGLFVYHRMSRDAELTVMQATGMSPWKILRPGLKLSALVMLLLFFIMSWLSPVTLAHMNQLRQIIKAQYSTLLLREGVFNSMGPDVTVYIAERSLAGRLHGLMIYDARPENPLPVTVLAREGMLVSTREGQQIVVENGTRQTFRPETRVLERLNFDRYTIDLPDSGPVSQRWAEPEERTLVQLITGKSDSTAEDQGKSQDIIAEIHRRLISPFLAPCFLSVTLFLMLMTPFGRNQQISGIVLAIGVMTLLQGLYLGSFSLAKENGWGIALMYLTVFGPLFAVFGLLIRMETAPGPTPGSILGQRQGAL